MIRLSLNEIIRSYEAIKKIAIDEYYKGNLELSLDYIDKAAVLAQQFNWIYSDAELEDLLQKISFSIFSDKSEKYNPVKNRVVIFDDYCRTFVLALQYIEALLACDFEILYITGKDFSSSSQLGFALDKIKNYPNVTIEIIPQNSNRIKRLEEIYAKIYSFKPSKVLLHLTSNSVCIPVLYSLDKQISRYIINLADQTFWLGSKGIDYSFEFRSFGAAVSFEKRGLNKEQLIYLPFYPIVDKNPFQGFPEVTKDKVVIFSGGDFYKTIDTKNTYWRLVKSILNQNHKAIILFATKADTNRTKEFIDNFITENNFEDRFIYTGFRADIDEVFKHCDIFMGTCPASGSLMSQLAAVNSKPILQFYLPGTPDDETEAAICHNHTIQISFSDEQKLLVEAKKLIDNADYRVQKGKEMNECMLTVEQFNTLFKQCIETNKSTPVITENSIDYNALTQRWYWIEYMGFIDTTQFVFSIFGSKRCKIFVPTVWLKFNYRRYFQTKILSIKWYKERISRILNR